jgi:hypothetical protein
MPVALIYIECHVNHKYSFFQNSRLPQIKMEDRKENIKKMLIKLQVLENKIQDLESMTEDILDEANTEYRNQIKELIQKKETMKQLLSQIQKSENN